MTTPQPQGVTNAPFAFTRDESELPADVLADTVNVLHFIASAMGEAGDSSTIFDQPESRAGLQTLLTACANQTVLVADAIRAPAPAIQTGPVVTNATYRAFLGDVLGEEHPLSPRDALVFAEFDRGAHPPNVSRKFGIELGYAWDLLYRWKAIQPIDRAFRKALPHVPAHGTEAEAATDAA